jgi:hypothetical protein
MTRKVDAEPRRGFSRVFRYLNPKCSTYGEKGWLGVGVGAAEAPGWLVQRLC